MSSEPSSSQHGNDDGHHRRVMLIAAIAIILLLGAMVWVAQMIVSQQKLERCLSSGRRDCLQIEAPPREIDPGGNQSGDGSR